MRSMTEPFARIDHVQLAMPRGKEDDARRFYVDLMGMEEVAKPEALAKRGGAWFRSGRVELHLGVEDDFRPARKAHPALVCTNYDQLVERLRIAGATYREDSEIPGVRRCHLDDCFGNRIELIAAPSQPRT